MHKKHLENPKEALVTLLFVVILTFGKLLGTPGVL